MPVHPSKYCIVTHRYLKRLDLRHLWHGRKLECTCSHKNRRLEKSAVFRYPQFLSSHIFRTVNEFCLSTAVSGFCAFVLFVHVIRTSSTFSQVQRMLHSCWLNVRGRAWVDESKSLLCYCSLVERVSVEALRSGSMILLLIYHVSLLISPSASVDNHINFQIYFRAIRMSCPESVTMSDISGQYTINKSLSDDPEKALEIRGVGWALRKAQKVGKLQIFQISKNWKTSTSWHYPSTTYHYYLQARGYSFPSKMDSLLWAYGPQCTPRRRAALG